MIRTTPRRYPEIGQPPPRPAGARGGVLELRDHNSAMVEIATPELDPAARIVFVPIAKLRRLD
jgi:hypothetical protein